jgi:NADPH:quinone reductase-like Zn-dependent oxidoreductase
MKAITQERYGAPDVLRVRQVDAPIPTDKQVLVRVHAAALNALDWHVMRGDPYLVRLAGGAEFGRRGPKITIRGKDFAGRVEAVGAGVSAFRPGDEVFGVANATFAEYVCAPEDDVETKPANLTFEQAAAVPIAGITALEGLRGHVQPGQRVLINGASGGVGTFAVQIAKALGAEVTAVCSTRNLDLIRSLGADRVIDYKRDDFARADDRYDLVFDLVANRSLGDLRRVLTPSGTLMLSGGGTSKGGSLFGPLSLVIRGAVASRLVRGQRIILLTIKPSRPVLAELRELIEAGKVTPVIDRTYPLDEVPAAIRYLETEHARAKVVITV